jgi:hypothetical protein
VLNRATSEGLWSDTYRCRMLVCYSPKFGRQADRANARADRTDHTDRSVGCGLVRVRGRVASELRNGNFTFTPRSEHDAGELRTRRACSSCCRFGEAFARSSPPGSPWLRWVPWRSAHRSLGFFRCSGTGSARRTLRHSPHHGPRRPPQGGPTGHKASLPSLRLPGI